MSDWVRGFRVQEAESGKFLVTSWVYPSKSPEAGTRITVTKSWGDFKALSSHLQMVHRRYPRSDFPLLTGPLTSSSSKQCQRFLEFASEIPSLYNSQSFVTFCHKDSSPKSSPLLTPVEDPDPGATDSPIPVEVPSYLSQAAEDISRAMKMELEANFAESIGYYKSAVATMLQNVHKDGDSKRQASVKRRICQYIEKTDGLQKKMEGRSPFLQLVGDPKDLKNRYKILGILGNKVLLVQDLFEDRKVVIKTSQKSNKTNRSNKSILPLGVPHSCQVLCYYETSDLLYLVLEFVDGGLLYEAVRRHFSKSNKETRRDESVSPYGEARTSVIKPSESFVRVRRKPSFGLENDLEHVGMQGSEMFCVSQGAIEKVGCPDEFFDFMNDILADEEGIDATDFSSEPSSKQDTDKLLNDARSLLTNVSSKLEESKEVSDQVLKHLEKIQVKVNSRLLSEEEEEIVYCHTPSKYLEDLDKSPASPATLVSSGSVSPSPKCATSVPSSPGFPRYSSLPTPVEIASNTPSIPICTLRGWTMQLFSSLFSYHSRGLTLRNLGPKDLMLDHQFNLVLTYKFSWTMIGQDLDLFSQYLAPELRNPLFEEQTVGAADWWSAGVILYELYTGSSFSGMYPTGLTPRNPVEFYFEIPRPDEEHQIESDFQNLISHLLQPNPADRTGSKEIRQHKFFDGVEWP